MKLFNLTFLAFFLSMFWWSRTAAAPVLPMTESVYQSGPVTQFLWRRVNEGEFYNELPPFLAHKQPEWRNFLQNRARNIIQEYYA